MQVHVDAGGVTLDGDLGVPGDVPGGAPDAPRAQGLVVFAHGSGSSRRSRRNVEVAEALQRAGLATLLFDLLTAEEGERDRVDRSLRFDIGLLGDRLAGAVRWAGTHEQLRGQPVGLFGASTGAAAALVAAAQLPDAVRAVVSRGGRPDLAGDALPDVRAPVLLIVGGADQQVLGLNEEAAARLRAPHETSVVPGASHLFEEPGALDEVTRLAADWFRRHLAT